MAQHLIAARTTKTDGELACDWRLDAQPEPRKDVRLQVNGLAAVVGDGTRIGAPCYFSGDGGRPLVSDKRSCGVTPCTGMVRSRDTLGPTDHLTIEFEITQLTPVSLPTWRKLLANDSTAPNESRSLESQAAKLQAEIARLANALTSTDEQPGRSHSTAGRQGRAGVAHETRSSRSPTSIDFTSMPAPLTADDRLPLIAKLSTEEAPPAAAPRVPTRQDRRRGVRRSTPAVG